MLSKHYGRERRDDSAPATVRFPRHGCIARIGRDFVEDRILQASPGIPGRHYLAIFVLASATLSYQILITRFFSVILYYHFAFAAISLAMLGLTRGTMEVYGKPERYAPERRNGWRWGSRTTRRGSRSPASAR